jgi:putative tributyrin esterase
MLKNILSTFVFLFCAYNLKAQDQVVYNSKNLPMADTVWIFTPKNLSENAPVLFLLHGYSGNYKQWDGIMNAQKYADEFGFIIVCPDGLYNSWYLNSPINKQWQYENFFFDELYPDIFKRYNADKNKVFISGLSMGGHGALHLFLRKPNLFASAGSTSGGVRLTDGTGKYGLVELLGNRDENDKNWQSFSVLNNIEKLKGSDKPFIFDCGSADFFYDANNQLKKKCDELKLNATYISQPGAHNRAYWAKSIKQQFEFFSKLARN